MIDRDRDTRPAELRDELGRLLDRLGTVVVGREWSFAATPAGAHDDRAGFAERRRDAAPGPAGRSRNDRHPAAQRPSVW